MTGAPGSTRRPFTAAEGAGVYFAAIAVNLVIQLVAGIALGGARQALSKEAFDTAQLVVMLFLQLGFFFSYFLFARSRNASAGITFRTVRPVTAALSPLAAALSIAAFIFPTALFSMLLGKVGYVGSGGVSFDTPANIVLGLAATVVAAPVCEELVFRGALLGGLSRR